MNRLLLSLIGGLGLLLAPAASGQPEKPAPPAGEPPARIPNSDINPLEGIPNLDIQYYDVSGRSADEIRASINRVRPRDPNDGLPVDALNRWYMSWQWPGDGRGGCDLAKTEIRFTATLQMPRLANIGQTPAPVLARWRTYYAALELHEAGHLRNAYDNMGTVLRAIRASTCDGANEAGRNAVRTLARWDVDYDRATRHGATQGAYFP